MVYDLGVIAGAVASVGITLAANLVGGTAKYLEEAQERIKQYIIDMFDITGDIADIVANFSAAFAEVFSVFADENGQTFTANLIGFFQLLHGFDRSVCQAWAGSFKRPADASYK